EVPVAIPGGLSFIALASGNAHACAVTTSGAAYCWGFGGDGQFGNGSTTDSADSPIPVAVSGGLSFTALAGGDGHTCGLTTSGAAYCWGSNNDGQLGTGSTTESSMPVAVSGGLTFNALDAGMQHTCGLAKSGAAYCWGYNGYGQLGNGSTSPIDGSSPVRVPVAVVLWP